MRALGIEGLIGKKKGDSVVKKLLLELNEKPVIDKFAGMEINVYPESGIEIHYGENKRVLTIFMYGLVDDDHRDYKGTLPLGIDFKNDRMEVGQKLGLPTLNGIKKETKNPWERFDYENYCIHFQYNKDCSKIQVVSLMSIDMVKGKF